MRFKPALGSPGPANGPPLRALAPARPRALTHLGPVQLRERLGLVLQLLGSLRGGGGGAGPLGLGASLSRYRGPDQLRSADQDGEALLQLDLRRTPSGAAFVQVLAGETWYFQAWHRDVVGGAATSNFTNGLEILFN